MQNYRLVLQGKCVETSCCATFQALLIYVHVRISTIMLERIQHVSLWASWTETTWQWNNIGRLLLEGLSKFLSVIIIVMAFSVICCWFPSCQNYISAVLYSVFIEYIFHYSLPISLQNNTSFNCLPDNTTIMGMEFLYWQSPWHWVEHWFSKYSRTNNF